MFGYLHLETETKVEPKFTIIGEPSSSTQANAKPYFHKKVINTPI